MRINPISSNSFGARMTRNTDIVWDDGYREQDINSVSKQDIAESYDKAIEQLSSEKRAAIVQYNKAAKKVADDYTLQRMEAKKNSIENEYNNAIQTASARKKAALAIDDILHSKEATDMIESLPDEDLIIINTSATVQHYSDAVDFQPITLRYGTNTQKSVKIFNSMNEADLRRITVLKNPFDKNGNADKNRILAYLERLCEVFGNK